ncbi:hypothetical protein RFI_31560 [Reticulomyxa filosa]|uniref:Uncharacterized protein n=1 Tax=Reticulomyxa filosa TaxID=46433 RepID=X6LYN5_RETFI|nr:hypothetical protein RFI_31560 [Reticulomyxa filosa]|eukprot:ETO05835.1 hypothetical protein RFI_31560 [Reticulomyxa filosa]
MDIFGRYQARTNEEHQGSSYEEIVLVAAAGKISKSRSHLKNHLNGEEEPFRILTQCSHENCEFYTRDVIRGNFHMYLSVKEDDQLTDIIKDMVFCMARMVMRDEAMNIPMIEAIFYHFNHIITKYVQFLSLCNDETVLSDIKKILLANGNTIPLQKMINVSCALSNYVLVDVPQKGASEFISKMDIACNATRAILRFLQQQPASTDKMYEDFLIVYRQLHMKTLGIKHMWKDCPTAIVEEKQDAVSMLGLVEHGFLKDNNVIPEIIKTAAKYIVVPDSKTQSCLYFIDDLLHVVQMMECVNDPSNEKVFQHVLQTIFFRPQDFVHISSFQSLLRLRVLELLVRNRWTHILKEPPNLWIELNRVHEKLYINTQFKGCALDQQSRTRDQKISVVSQLKVRLIQSISSLVKNATILEYPSENEKIRLCLIGICKDLSYFRDNQKLFEQWQEYEDHLHIWFLKQCCMSKNMDWLQMFFSQPWLRQEFTLFGTSKIFSQLQRRDHYESFARPFNESFGKRYKSFKDKLISGDYNCYVGSKEDIPSLLTAALFLSSSISPENLINIMYIYTHIYVHIYYTYLQKMFFFCQYLLHKHRDIHVPAEFEFYNFKSGRNLHKKFAVKISDYKKVSAVKL